MKDGQNTRGNFKLRPHGSLARTPLNRSLTAAAGQKEREKKVLAQSVSSNGERPAARLRGGTLRSDRCRLPLLRPGRSNYRRRFTDAPGVPDAINKLRRSPGIRTVSAAGATSEGETEGKRFLGLRVGVQADDKSVISSSGTQHLLDVTRRVEFLDAFRRTHPSRPRREELDAAF